MSEGEAKADEEGGCNPSRCGDRSRDGFFSSTRVEAPEAACPSCAADGTVPPGSSLWTAAPTGGDSSIAAPTRGGDSVIAAPSGGGSEAAAQPGGGSSTAAPARSGDSSIAALRGGGDSLAAAPLEAPPDGSTSMSAGMARPPDVPLFLRRRRAAGFAAAEWAALLARVVDGPQAPAPVF